MTTTPRVYNLFPLLAGPIEGWGEHLPRIARMNFDWIYVNPFHYPGFSGSLYAIKDFERLHPVVQGDSEEAPDRLVAGFVEQARGHGLRVMLDLVINHTAKDALLVQRHPDWYLREPDGELHSPRAVDPVDPRNVTVWGDLAELDYGRTELHAAMVDHWNQQVARYQEQGIAGFRCDAAYQVPAAIWSDLIAAAKARDPDCLFAAETLGCTPDEVAALTEAGFDMLFNSSKWWDFRADWLLEQYELYRHIAPSIAFPESHDTDRLVSELDNAEPLEVEQRYRQRYLFAASFSSGVMLPMGYEYGFAKRLDVVSTRPADWWWEASDPRFDLTEFIAETNSVKSSSRALQVEGPQRRITASDGLLVGLLRLDGGDERFADHAALTLINPEPVERGLDGGPLLAEIGGRFWPLRDVTPELAPLPLEPGLPVTLQPFEARLFVGEATKAERAKPPSEKTSERRLQALSPHRIAIERVYPELDGGRHAVKRTVGDVLEVRADIFCDGHEKIAAVVRYRRQDQRRWREVPMRHVDNDRWVGRVPLVENARYIYTIDSWRDLFATWREDLIKKHDAGQAIALELLEGRHLVEAAEAAATGRDKSALAEILAEIDESSEEGRQMTLLLSASLHEVMARSAPRTNLSSYDRELEVVVDRPAARYGAWYEMFPRSQSDDPKRHGTFDDVIRKLPYVRDMGFDVLYFTPIHPIGKTERKGRNNSLNATPDDPGSPYAIGSTEGGHDALHPELGDFDDFARLVEAAHEHGLEIALDFAIQCSRDHPWLKEHPEWFDWRPDGSIKFAENPPKKYQDIVNVHFYREALPSIWYALRDIILFWAERGVRIFRVDNPHTKPLPFWEWMIRDVQDRHPDVIFLSEAFTRPKMMNRLAKVGFTQSYTYFTWRNTKSELTEYLTELTREEPREYFRPNFFVNTPDINPVYLQTGGRAGFMVRAVLAGTLSGAYGIYSGFELCEATPVPGKEDYLNSEKYEIKAWDWDRPGNIRDYITRLNAIRRTNPALHDHLNVQFCNAWNDNILVYGKMTAARDNVILVAVNLDPHNAQECNFEVPLWELGMPDDSSVQVEELLTGESFTWHGKIQHVWLDPAANPCAIWRITPPGH